LDKDGNFVKLANGADAVYTLPIDAILSVADGEVVGPGATLSRVTTGGAKTRDITGGLPRVAELFEARRPKDHAIIAEIDGRVEFGKDYKNKRKVLIVPDDETQESATYLIAKGKHLTVQDGDRIMRGEYLLDGNPAPQDILAVLGIEALAEYLVEEVQKVYRLQGVGINDKHIETIVRQMLQKVEVTDPGDTDMIKGDAIDEIDLLDENARMKELGLKEATAMPVLLGITKASLQTRSFISAASFQETTRVLTDAAVNGKHDTLEGLKENVIVGRLIPAGTGGALRRLKAIAAHQDAEAAIEVDMAMEPLPSEVTGDEVAGMEVVDFGTE
jgi:DNA-directed RNA polymerase subunit beta'